MAPCRFDPMRLNVGREEKEDHVHRVRREEDRVRQRLVAEQDAGLRRAGHTGVGTCDTDEPIDADARSTEDFGCQVHCQEGPL